MPATSSERTSEQAPAGGGLVERYESVKRRIADAARRSGRDPGQIVLVAVTKNAAIDEVRRLVELGHQDFGENRVQNLEKRVAVIEEFVRRHHQLSGGRSVDIPDRVRWHMIGHLQRNKARKVARLVRLIHSVDSLRLVEELHAIATRLDHTIELLIQVNAALEKQKFGVAPAAARHLVEQVDTMIGLRPRGLMCMAPETGDPEQSRPVFERCAELFGDIRTSGAGGDRFDILSMGMTGDFEVAIECGSNMVRVGTAIFGPGTSGEPETED
jgi:pyridoxal phosphate enzyme (YggS family)